jgi:hypothetical protein
VRPSILGAIILGITLNASLASADVIVHVEALLDGQDQLVIGPTGLFWNHIDFIKPGYNGGPVNDSSNGPSYVNGVPWTATWSDPGTRTPGISSVFLMSTASYLGFTPSTVYGHEFDNYQGNGETGFLGPQVVINRGPVGAGTYNGLSAVTLNDDAFGGYNVYSVDLHFAPEPSSICLLVIGTVTLLSRRKAF